MKLMSSTGCSSILLGATLDVSVLLSKKPTPLIATVAPSAVLALAVNTLRALAAIAANGLELGTQAGSGISVIITLLEELSWITTW